MRASATAGNHAPKREGGLNMPTLDDAQSWRGRTLVDRDGDKIGSIEDVYLDRRSGEPEWVAVKTGLFGSKLHFVPIRDASPAGEDVRVEHEKDLVKDAPNVEADGELSPEEERRLYQHYGRTDYDEWTDDTEDRTEATLGRDTSVGRGDHTVGDDDDVVGRGDRTVRDDDDVVGRGDVTVRNDDAVGRDDDTVGRDVSGPTTDDAMTRSEEELAVGTQRREAGRARLRKYVVTENQQEPVRVGREEARAGREPIGDDNIDQALK